MRAHMLSAQAHTRANAHKQASSHMPLNDKTKKKRIC